MNKIEEAIDLLQHGIDDSFVQEGEIMQQAIDILSEPKTEPTELTELARRFLPPQEIFDEAELADVSERPGQLDIIAHKLCNEIDRLTAELAEARKKPEPSKEYTNLEKATAKAAHFLGIEPAPTELSRTELCRELKACAKTMALQNREIDRLTAELKAKDEVLESIARISTIIEPVGMNRDSVTAVHNAQHREIQKQIEQELSI